MDSEEYRTIELSEDAYQRLERHKRDGESVSDTLQRIAGERSLLELAGIVSDEEAEEMREAIREQEDRSRDELT